MQMAIWRRATRAGAIPPDFASARRCVCSRARGTSPPTKPAPSRRAAPARKIARPWPPDGRGRPGAKARRVAVQSSSRSGAEHLPRRFSGKAAADSFSSHWLNSPSGASSELFIGKARGTFVSRRAGDRRSGFPDDVQDDIFEIRIAVVAVRVPAVAAQINFHVAGARRFAADLDDRAAKIRPALGAGKTGMQHADGFPVRSFQLVAPQPLMPPDGLEQPLGGKAVFVVQNIRGAALVAPDGVKISRIHGRVFESESLAFAPVRASRSQVYFERNSGGSCLFNIGGPKFLFAVARCFRLDWHKFFTASQT